MSESRALVVTPQMVDYPEQGREPGSMRERDADLTKLLQYYTDAEQTSAPAREKAERDRDYVDNKQLTDEEVRALQKRGQPPISLNVIRSRAAFLAGMEKKQRRDPKAYPRNNPQDVDAAEAFTDGMRYVVEKADYATKRSQAWKNITIEGYGGIEIAAVTKADGDVEFSINRIPWDRLFYDPHSAEPDFSDARYIGQVLWQDYDQALADAAKAGYVDEDRAAEILDTTMSSAPAMGRTYDDKPKWTVWADGKRKRVRIVKMWHLDTDGWKYCEFTKSGFLDRRAEPYVDQDGDSYCPWLLESANVDRDNNRYGEVRHLIDPQDEINKRRSKALHLLNTNGVIADEGAVDDINAARRELARPDFWLTKNTGRTLEIIKGADLAAGQAQLGDQAMRYVEQAGANQALRGTGPGDQSGRALEAQQAGGLVEQSDLMDTLRRLDWRAFNVIASMMKQFWNRQKWVRVTDDEDAPKWVGLNEPMWTDPATGESAPESEWRKHFEGGGGEPGQIERLEPAIDEETGEPKLANEVARLDMDILVSDAPDQITLAGEDWTAMTQLLGMNLPPARLKLAIEMHPALPSKRKKQFIEMIDAESKEPPPPGAEEVQRLAKEMAEAKIARERAATYKDLTTGESTMARIGAPAQVPPAPDVQAGLMDEQGAPTGPPQGPGMPQEPMMAPAGPMPPPMPEGPPEPPPQGPPVGLMTRPEMVG